MSFCEKCGTELVDKYLENEGNIPYCNTCQEFRFPTFSTAISAIVYNEVGDKILLIKQYGKDRNILVAGYINKGECAEHALVREIKEEMGLDVIDFTFNASEYFQPTNTLMINFACRVRGNDLSKMTDEVDFSRWYTESEARENIFHNSLAENFLLKWLDKRGQI